MGMVISPECDKSFTRSDALAKHMRIQHNISPPLPGRGGSRKRKRDEAELGAAGSAAIPGNADPSTSGTAYGYNTFKIEPNHQHVSDPHGDPDESGRGSPLGEAHTLANGGTTSRPLTPDSDPSIPDEDDQLPEHLLATMDPNTGLIMGRTPTMVRYLLLKAKHRYALEQHEALLEELRIHRYEEKCWRERKDALLDELLRVNFGCVILSHH